MRIDSGTLAVGSIALTYEGIILLYRRRDHDMKRTLA